MKRHPIYLYASQYGQEVIDVMVYVSAVQEYDSFRLFVGPWCYRHASVLERAPLTGTGVQRMRDGGTTYVHTDSGRLYVPSPMRTRIRGDQASWAAAFGAQFLTKLNPEEYEITETDTSAIVKTKEA